VLRLPGHGTLPSMMTQMHARDWVAAVRIAARDVASRTPPGQPFYIGGYSTGGTWRCATRSMRSQDERCDARPRAAGLARDRSCRRVAAWRTCSTSSASCRYRAGEGALAGRRVEYDPYKFNSFP
jgi:hypothetical protein